MTRMLLLLVIAGVTALGVDRLPGDLDWVVALVGVTIAGALVEDFRHGRLERGSLGCAR